MRPEAKSIYGLQSKDYLTSKDPHFLREGVSLLTDKPIFQLTEPSNPVGEFHGEPYGDGMVVVEEQDHNGFFEHGMSKEKASWK